MSSELDNLGNRRLLGLGGGGIVELFGLGLDGGALHLLSNISNSNPNYGAVAASMILLVSGLMTNLVGGVSFADGILAHRQIRKLRRTSPKT